MMAVKLDGEFTFQNMFNIEYCGKDKVVFRQYADRRYGICENSDHSSFVIAVFELIVGIMVDNTSGLLYER